MESSTDRDVRILREKELADLRDHWEGPYRIWAEGSGWNACHESGRLLTARTAQSLRRQIRRDYFRRTAPRHLAVVR